MAKGKRATQVNSTLRDQLKQAEEARRRLERRLREAELDRDELRERLAKVEAHEHPAVEAARLRAEAARANEIAAKGQAREDMREFVTLLGEALRQGGVDRHGLQLNLDQWERLDLLAGFVVEEVIWEPPSHNRSERRLSKMGPSRYRKLVGQGCDLTDGHRDQALGRLRQSPTAK